MHTQFQGPAYRVGLLRPRGGEPHPHPRLRQSGQGVQQRVVVEQRAVQGQGVHLIQRHDVAQQRPRLLPLGPETGQGVLLHLVHLGVEPPVADVGVAPLARHDDVGGPPVGQPGREELLRTPVRPRGVHPSDTGGVRRVQHGEGALTQGGHVTIGRQGRGTAEVDVGRPPDRREPHGRARHSVHRLHGRHRSRHPGPMRRRMSSRNCSDDNTSRCSFSRRAAGART